MALSVPEGPLALVSVHSGNVLDVVDGAGVGAAAVQSADQGTERQRWRLVFVVRDDQGSDFYKIVNLHSGLALEIEHESPDNGAAVLQRAYPEGHEALHMQWKPVLVESDTDGSYYIVNRRSQKSFDVEGGETEESRREGARVIQWSYWAGKNQQWRIISALPGDPLDHPASKVPARPILNITKALSLMRPIHGWFSEQEAGLLLGTVSRALEELPDDCTVVEIGSYLGRSTVLLASAVHDLRPDGQVFAIDPHGGTVSAGDGLAHGTPTYDTFCANIAAAGLQDSVCAIRQCSTDISWDRRIGLLFIDGLHDYESVSADFRHFKRWIVAGGLVAFHDYSTYWPGVVQFVDELLRPRSDYEWVDWIDSLVVLRKRS